MKHKLYFAKSNAVSTSTIDLVRKYLKTLDIELKEYSNGRGNYTHDELLSCDSMIILPSECDDYQTTIGKGIYSQIQAFEKMLRGKKIKEYDDRILVVTNIDEIEKGDLWVSNFRSMELIDANDWTSYAELYVDCMTDRPLSKVFLPFTTNPCNEIPLENSFSSWYKESFEKSDSKSTSGIIKLKYKGKAPTWRVYSLGEQIKVCGITFEHVGDSKIDGMPMFKFSGTTHDTIESAFRKISGIDQNYTIEYVRSLEEQLIGRTSRAEEFPLVQPLDKPIGTLMYLDYVYGDWKLNPKRYLLIG